MGYYVDQVEDNFYIKKENISLAWKSLRGVFEQEEKSIHDGSGWHYAWIDTDRVLNAKTFAEAMSAARWEVYEDYTGNIFHIQFTGEKLGDDSIILEAISPYVVDGSYIIMHGEDGDRWKWKFNNGSFEEVDGHWVFDDEEET